MIDDWLYRRDGDGFHADRWRTPACTDACEIRLAVRERNRYGVVHYDYAQDAHGRYAAVELPADALTIEADPVLLATWRDKLGRALHVPVA